MVFKLFKLSVILIFFFVTSCDSPQKSAQEIRFENDSFFSGMEKTLRLEELKNELASGETDFLKHFAKDDFPWQKWDRSILKKATDSQAPIFLLIGSTLGGDSLSAASEIVSSPSLHKILSEQFVCAVADIQVHPELGLLSYYLSSEIRRSTSFPTLVWMSHEGFPIAWIPIPGLKGRELDIVIKNSTAMVSDIWKNDSEYAVTNSRQDNAARQLRLESHPAKEDGISERIEVFQQNTRQLSALYSSGDRDLDYIGGLIPTSSLELLAIGSVSKELTAEINALCLKASNEVLNEIISGALKDQLDGFYFYARRTTDWSLPSFSKSISSQAKVASMLLHVGQITGNPNAIKEGLRTLKMLKSDWINAPKSMIAPAGDADTPGIFLWNWSSLESALDRSQLNLAIEAFSMKKEGNIPSEVDPLSNYFRLNSLRSRISTAELAEKSNQPEEAIITELQSIKEALLKHRHENMDFTTESVISCSDLSLVVSAQISAANITGHVEELESAKSLAENLKNDFFDADNGLSRLPLTNAFVPARAGDYANFSLVFLSLYQATLDPAYLAIAHETMTTAVAKLSHSNGLLSETPENADVIPLRMINSSMIFSDSSLGAADQAFTRLKAITGITQFDKIRTDFAKAVAESVDQSTVNHTDFITNCALGEEPLIAVLQGDPASETGKSLLALLNSRKYLSFLSVRAESGHPLLAKLDQLPAASGEASVALVRNGKALGQALDREQLEQLLSSLLFDRN